MNRWGRWKENISHGAKIPRDPWKIFSRFGLFSKCFMASSLNDLTLSFRSSGHDAGKVMRQARYLPEMSLPILSLKLSNYTGQKPACGITTTPRLPVNPTLLLIAYSIFSSFNLQQTAIAINDVFKRINYNIVKIFPFFNHLWKINSIMTLSIIVTYSYVYYAISERKKIKISYFLEIRRVACSYTFANYNETGL